MVGSDFVPFQMSIEQFVKIEDHEMYRRNVLIRACQSADLKLLFSDFLFVNYETLEEDVQMNDGFTSLDDAKLAFIIY